MRTFEYPEYRWDPWYGPSITHVTLGADRYTKDTDDTPAPVKRRPVGFAPPYVDPLVWAGDNA